LEKPSLKYHLYRTLRLVVADTGEGLFTVDDLGNSGIGMSHAYYLIDLGHSNPKSLYGLGGLEFVFYGLKSAQSSIVDFEDGLRTVRICISFAIAAFSNLFPG
jgi:hypothetical protein